MQRETQISLLEELLGLQQGKALFLDEQVSGNATDCYWQDKRFDREQQALFRKLPLIAAHASELAGAGSFIRRQIAGRPLLIIRGDDGSVRAFLNVCRHRGTRLVSAESGCRQRFSCPYHAWTWNSCGEFIGAPHFEQGFPGLDKEKLNLRALGCVERHGFIWVMPIGHENYDIDNFLSGLADDLGWINTAGLKLKFCDEQLRHANWKFIAEGGLEAYHFRVAHRHTIAGLFNDNLSSYQTFGYHIRSVLPRATIADLRNQPREQWDIRAHTNLLYTLFPTTSLLVQQDHVVWIQSEPVNAQTTRLRLATLAPGDSSKPDDYWQKNHEFTLTTLNEDFAIAESIQDGVQSGANSQFHFGRFEGALGRFNKTIESLL